MFSICAKDKQLIDYSNKIVVEWPIIPPLVLLSSPKWVSVLLHAGIIMCEHVTPCVSCGTKNPLPHLNWQLHLPSRTHLALTHISLFLASAPFFSGPPSCLHLSDPVITADPSLDLSTAKEITPKAAQHIWTPVWSGGEGLPDPLMLINWGRLWGFKKGPVRNWVRRGVCVWGVL